jgi:hypothetical protein
MAKNAIDLVVKNAEKVTTKKKRCVLPVNV